MPVGKRTYQLWRHTIIASIVIHVDAQKKTQMHNNATFRDQKIKRNIGKAMR